MDLISLTMIVVFGIIGIRYFYIGTKLRLKATDNPRIFRYGHRIFFEYKRKSEKYENENFNNEEWYFDEVWSVFIGVEKKLYNVESFYWDGNHAERFTILGLQFGKSYSYDARAAKA